MRASSLSVDIDAAANLTYAPPPTAGCLWQGEILSNLLEPLVAARWSTPEGAETEVQLVAHPYALVMTQSCDLRWDFEGRETGKVNSQLSSVLFCAAEPAEILRSGLPPGSDIWKRVRQNADERYMVLRAVPAALDRQAEGIPELGLDFKRYFTLPVLVVYEQLAAQAVRRSVLSELYASHLSARFFSFQARIGLPVDHHWQPPAVPVIAAGS